MLFPYERYETLAASITFYYPTGEATRASWVFQCLEKASTLLTQLLGQPVPLMKILLVDVLDWPLAPREEPEEGERHSPYWTNATSPPSLVIPTEVDALFGTMTQEKFAFTLYHELTLAFLEADPRPWPNDYPLWADEWQLKCAALWLSQHIDGQQGLVNTDLREQYAEIFEPEEDGKTPMTVRSFDWYEDTPPEDYLGYELVLEQFAADLLAHYEPEVLPRFLALYRTEHQTLLSDEVTAMLAAALGPGGSEWLEGLVYF